MLVDKQLSMKKVLRLARKKARIAKRFFMFLTIKNTN